MPQKTKLALIISGAISLGSYQAGVIYELFSLLKKMGDDADFEIDVVTGASAGSVNSVILALAMMYDEDLIKYTQKIWIDGLDLSVLLEKVDAPWRSLFSNRIIDEVKQDLLNGVKQSSGNTSGFFPEKVKVAVTLSNLSGIPYEIKFNNKKEGYPLTTFADWFSMGLTKGDKSPETLKEIERMIDLAIASGAFPFAFPAQQRKRKWKNYQHTAIKKPPSGEVGFVYVDGGMFNNEPINRARELAVTLDTADTERIYLLVDPSPPKAELPFEKLDMLSVGIRIFPAVFAEARFRDWYHAVKVNQRIEWQLKMIMEMKGQMSQLGEAEVTAISKAWALLTEEISAFKARKAGVDKDVYLNKNKQRVNEFLKENDLAATGQDGALLQESLVNFVFVMENIAGLRGKKQLDIRLLTPHEKGILAGDFLASFGGFFSREYREHDFNIGRTVVRDFVQKAKDQGGLGRDLSPYSLQPAPYDPDLDAVNMKDAPEGQKIKLRDNVVERVDSLVVQIFEKRGAKFWQRILGPIVLMFVSWRWLIRKVIKAALTDILNKQLGLKK